MLRRARLSAAGALTRHPAGVVAIASALGIFQLATVVADTRLQDSITGPARATVTSLAGMTMDVAISLWLLATRRLTSSVVEGEGSMS